MPLVKDVTDVYQLEGAPIPILVIKGSRHDNSYFFHVELQKNEQHEWVERLCYHISGHYNLYNTGTEQWDEVVQELLDHPKVRLHTLF